MAKTEGSTRLDYHIKDSHVVNGVRFHYSTKREYLEDIKTMEIHEDDLFLIGYCKTGNNWLRRIVGAILSRNDLDTFENSPPKLGSHLDINSPRLLSHPTVLYGHLPYNFLPESLSKHKGKVIYMVRNPKDVAVSFYHFHKVYELYGPWEGDWEVFIEAYFTGNVMYGSWYDHVKSFWNHRDDVNILFVKYEDLKLQQREWIQIIANFLGRPLPATTLDRISVLMQFDNLKKHPTLSLDIYPNLVEGANFMRKGIIGDWVTLFTDEQSERADDLLKDLCQETGFNFYNKSSYLSW